MKIRDLDILNDPSILLEEKAYYLYGASSAGKQMLYLLEQVGISVVSFVDSAENAEGLWENIPIVPARSLKDRDVSNIRIIISSCFVAEIMSTLEQLGLPDPVDVCTGWSVRKALFLAGIAGEDYLDDVFKEQALAAHDWLGADREVVLWDRLLNSSFLQLLTDEKSFLIANPTKVGSVTIYNSLCQIGRKPFHCHILSSARDMLDPRPEIKDIRREQRKRLLEGQRRGKRLRIITGVREPISHGISMYWQVLDLLSIYWHEDRSYLSIGQSCLDFIKKYTWLAPADDEALNPAAYGYFDEFRKNRKYGWEFDWYDQCIKEELGVDVYDYPFDREKGYTVIQTDYVEIFLYRLEDLNNLEKELAEFVGSPDFHLVNANTNGNKEYQFAYR